MKVLYLTNIPSPYRVAYFNELGKVCDLTVIFERSSSLERDDSWKNFSFDYFKGVILHGIRIRTDAAICPNIVKQLGKEKYDHIVVTNISSPTGILAIAWLKFHKIPYCIEGDGAFATEKYGWKQLIKTWIISDAVKCFSTSKEHDAYYIANGANKDTIVRYPFTSLFERDILKRPVTKDEKTAVKKKLSIKEKKIILAVGSYIHRKGFDLLIRAMEKMPDEWGVYIVGGVPTAAYLELQKALDLKHLYFVPFQNGDKLKEYFMAADIFVLPTREDIWGLVINEALSYGLPVVTTNRCIAGLELIKDGYNGFIVEHDNIDSLRIGIYQLMSAEDQWESYAENALRVIHEYTIEKMVEAHRMIWN